MTVYSLTWMRYFDELVKSHHCFHLYTSGIKRQDKKPSIAWVSTRSVQNFWATFANAYGDYYSMFQNHWNVRILRQPSASMPEGPELPLALIAAVLQ